MEIEFKRHAFPEKIIRASAGKNSRARFIFKARRSLSNKHRNRTPVATLFLTSPLDVTPRALKMKRFLEFLFALALIILFGNAWC